VESKGFKRLLAFVILLSCIHLVLDDPLLDPESDYKAGLDVANFVILAFFTLEAILKIIAFDFFWEENAYMRDSWNLIDMVIIITSYIDAFSNSVRN